MSRQVFTFSAGPCIFPMEVLLKVKQQLPKILNTSHDSEYFQSIEKECKELIKDLLKVPDNYEVFFMQSGATGQFAAVVQNYLGKRDNIAEYLVTGTWSLKAFNECKTLHGKPIQYRSEEGKVLSYIIVHPSINPL